MTTVKKNIFILTIFNLVLFFNNFSMQDGQANLKLEVQEIAANIILNAIFHSQTIEEFEAKIFSPDTAIILSGIDEKNRQKILEYITNFSQKILPELRVHKGLKIKLSENIEIRKIQQKNFWSFFSKNSNNINFKNSCEIIKKLKKSSNLTLKNLEKENIDLKTLKKLYLKSRIIEFIVEANKNKNKIKEQKGKVLVAFFSILPLASLSGWLIVQKAKGAFFIVVIFTVIIVFWCIKALYECCKINLKNHNRLEYPNWMAHDEIENFLIEKYVPTHKRAIGFRKNFLDELIPHFKEVVIEIFKDTNEVKFS